MRKGAVPVGGLYTIAFLILLGLAGMGLYVYLNGQSTARDYRIAAAGLLQTSEEFKRFIDQERLYVMETVLFFLGSQGGVDNIAEYNQYNSSVLVPSSDAHDAEASACHKLVNNRMGAASDEILYRCFNGRESLFNNPESEGVWKCDSKMYSYEECEEITLLTAELCCENAFKDGHDVTYAEIDNSDISDVTSNVKGEICHRGCVEGMELSADYTLEDVGEKCSNLDYCGALWCKSDNLEVPESYDGVPYYYKLGSAGPGYYCPSSYKYSPEKDYAEGRYWVGMQDTDYVVNKLINLSNDYFYKPSPEFEAYLSSMFDSEVQLSFQLNFKGCNKDSCEFAWVPYGESQEGFIGRGAGGVPMVDFSTDLLSVQTVEIPIEDMVDYTGKIINERRISNYLVDSLEDMVYRRETGVNEEDVKGLSKWSRVMGETVFGIDCDAPQVEDAGEDATNQVLDLYDNRSCGEDPYRGNCSYDCLMQHAGTELYNAVQDPFEYDRSEGYDYTLRPVFRFVETSMGASVDVTDTQGCSGSGGYCYGLDQNTCTDSNLPNCNWVTLTGLGQLFSSDYCSGDYDCTALGESLCTSLRGCSWSNQGHQEEEVNLKQGDYNIFVRGEGEADIIITIDGNTLYFEHSGSGSYYEPVTAPDNYDFGKCAWTSKDVKSDATQGEVTPEDYANSGFGCCPKREYDESTGTCNVDVVQNAYCDDLRNKYGLTRTGQICSFDSNDGMVNYEDGMISLNTDEYTIVVEASNDEAANMAGLQKVEIVRVDYDNTMDLKHDSKHGVPHSYGGSYEYYLDDEVEDCTEPVGENMQFQNTELTYSELSDVELWYSMLCARGRGYNWREIIDEETGLYNAFRSEFGSDASNQEGRMDSFLEDYTPTECELEGGVKLLSFNTGCSDSSNSVQTDAGSDEVPVEPSSETQGVSLETMESQREKLHQIELNTSYVSLPMKWIFAYTDMVSFDQTSGNMDEDAGCDLNYTDINGARGPPDCSCKECSEVSVCEFDFTNIQLPELINKLYKFDETFIQKYNEYKNAGVME